MDCCIVEGSVVAEFLSDIASGIHDFSKALRELVNALILLLIELIPLIGLVLLVWWTIKG